MIKSYLAPGINSITYETTRFGNIATGFNLTIEDQVNVSHDGEVSITIESNGETKEHKLGTKEGIVISDGIVDSRTSEGRTTVVVDPIMDLFKKAIIVTLSDSYLEQVINEAGRSGDNSFAVIMSQPDVLIANNKLKSGDVAGYIDDMFGLSGGVGSKVTILTDKVSESPIVSSLQTISSTVDTNSATGSFFIAGSNFERQGVYSVEDIFNDTLAPLGLELYWVNGSTYSLEPPRLSNTNSEVIGEEISKSEIISMNTITDPYNIPDIMIPDVYMPQIVGTGAASITSSEAIRSGVVSRLDSNKVMKIKTFKIPSFLINPISTAMRASAGAKDSLSQIPNLADEEATNNMITFFGSHARKTQMYGLTRGSCTLSLRPDITVPYSWYKIAGLEVFVSNIRHTVTRKRAITTLTIAGTRDVSKEIDDSGASFDPGEIMSSQESFIAEMNRSALNSIEECTENLSTILKEIESSGKSDSKSFYSAYSPDMSKDEVANVFGDEQEYNDIIEGVKETHLELRSRK